MSRNRFKVVFGLFLLLTTSVSYACYPGLDCPDDLPGNAKKITTPDEWQMEDRYLVKGGLVKDPTTGLVWMRCSFGQSWNGSTCKGKAAELSWTQAASIPSHFDYSGYSDWRVPTLEELKTLVYCSSGQSELTENGTSGCSGDYEHPTIVRGAFPETPSGGFWSSSPSANINGYAWIVYFYYGYGGHDSKDSNYLLRLVRNGK